MTEIQFPPGYRLERLTRAHPRKDFTSGQKDVDDWLRTKALQNQEKHLTTTTILLDPDERIGGFYTLAWGEADFEDFPAEAVRWLPKRRLPVAFIAWLGVAADRQGQGLGRRLLARALTDCWRAAQIIDFVAVVLDSIDETTKAFYQHAEFIELPGHPNRLFMGMKELDNLMRGAGA